MLASVPLQKFPRDFKDFPLEVPFVNVKWPCPSKMKSKAFIYYMVKEPYRIGNNNKNREDHRFT